MLRKIWIAIKAILDEGLVDYLNRPKPIIVESKPKSQHELLIQELNCIDESCFEYVNRPQYRLLEIEVLFHNINEYNMEYSKIMSDLNLGFDIANVYKVQGLKTIYLHDFFINKEGEYIDKEKTIQSFKHVAKYLIDYYYLNLDENNNYFIKYNIRILRFIIQNLKTVITSLNQYCQDSRHVLKDGTSENKLG